MATQPRIVPRYAHTAGPTSLAYTPDGKYLITVGSNELIRKYTVASEDEPITIDHTQDGKTSVAASNDAFAVSSEDGTVSLFSVATNTFSQFLVRTTLPARDVVFSPDGNWVAVASDETTVKVVSLEDNRKVIGLRAQSNSAKHVSFHPSGNYLAVSATDGAVYVYSLSSEEPTLVRKVDGIIKVLSGESEASSKVAWHPDGRAFLAPTPTRDLVLVDRANWTPARTFSGGHSGDITDFAWSPNGAFLASAGTDGKLVIWDSKTQAVVTKYDYKNIVALAWHPRENVISFTTNQGQLYTLPTVVPQDQAWLLELSTRTAPLKDAAAAAATAPVIVENRANAPPRQRKRSPALHEILGGEEEEEDVDEDEDDYGGGDDDEDNFVVDDDSGGYAETNVNGKRGNTHLLLPPSDLTVAKRRAFDVWSPETHTSFQPGSTPWRGKRRYLCLNLVGFIWTVDQDTHHTVTVEFYDREAFRDFHFTDPFLYDQASLTEHGTLLACPARDANPAMLYYRPHESWTTRADWRTALPPGENPVCVALSHAYIVACTDAGYIRVFTLFGIALRVYRQKHAPVVACASWRDYVFVVGNGPVGADGRAQLTYSVENVKRDESFQSGDTVALAAAGATLKSVLFSDRGDPCVYDSDGVLLVCVHWRQPGQAKWVPLLDTRLLERLASGRKEESYWPVAVAQDKFHCIILKGTEKHPYFPRPLLSEFDFQIPLSTAVSGPTASKSDTLEELFVRESVLLTLQRDSAAYTATTASEEVELTKRKNTIDKTLLQLLGMECQDDDRGAKALELCGLFRQPRTLEMAIKVAIRFGRTLLAEKIAELRDQMDLDAD